MDWQYILSLSPEDLNEDEKDDLYRTVTWHNLKNESLTLEKCIAFIKVCQEVLKFKGEQVEVLVHKLDELATQQGEEEGRQLESDTDAKSSKSRKSSTLEFEHLEQKYLGLRTKYKRQLKLNEKNSGEITKYQKKLAEVEQDKNRLINELQLINQDDTKSDISESVKEQHKELINTLHSKNKQLSDLLHDIEVTEHDNIILREKLTTVRDELSDATKELTVLIENLKASKIELDEMNETNKRLTAERNNLQDEMNDILTQKRQFEQEMEEFTEEVNVRVDEWKKILEEKEKEIYDLRSRQALSSNHSSLSSLPIDPTQVTTLNKTLIDREKQLIDLKTKLEDATKEMNETTIIMRNLKEENSKNLKKNTELEQVIKELKKQMKSSHERCQDLQDDLAYSERALQEKEDDFKTIIDRLQDEGQIDTSELLQKNQQLKSQNRTQEKQIMSLVKAANKLQDLCDQLEKENEVFRDRLGVGDDDVVNTGVLSLRQKQQKREISLLNKQILQLEDDKLELKLQKRQKQPESQTQVKALTEENEALRCGMHEILNSINSKKEIREVKSETLEKLLRALDVKHISGWYHPAMRLQAELHNQEGINSELREQLRLVRLESQSRSSTDRSKDGSRDVTDYSSIFEADAASLDQIQNKLHNLFEKLQNDSIGDVEIEKKLQHYKENFEEIRSQLAVLYEEYDTEKRILNDKMSEYEERIGDLEETNTILKTKLELLTKESSHDDILTRSLELAEDNVVLIRKRAYLQTEIERLTDRITNLENDLTEAKVGCAQKICELTKKNKSLSNTTEILANQLKFAISSSEHEQLQQKLDQLIIKHRDLLHNFNQIGEKQEFGDKMFEEMRCSFKKEKVELENKIVSLSEKLYSQENEPDASDLAKKLAASEVNEIRERQRANHTNNLFELVKEQLQKSEERQSQIDKYNKEVTQKHVLLQEQLKDAENKLVTFVDLATYKSFQTKYNELLQINTKLSERNIEIENDLAQIRTSTELKTYFDYQKNQQLLELKHQIVDLQANNDEKVQIARLASDLAYCRLQQTDSNKKIEELTQELNDRNRKYEMLSNEIEETKLIIVEKDKDLIKKVGMFRDLLVTSKSQYLGCVPRPSEEKYVFNIKQAILDKHDAFLALYNAQIVSNEVSVVKEQYETGYQEVKKLLKSANIDTIKEIMIGYQDKKQSQFNEIKYRRQSALKETQLQHVFDRVKIQDEQIIKLEEELFALHKNFALDFDPETSILPSAQSVPDFPKNAVKIMKHREIQTEEVISHKLQSQLNHDSRTDIAIKDEMIQQMKSKITENEMSLSLFRNQLGDKQSQITFYEKHILELQSKLEGVPKVGEDTTQNGDEIVALKCSLKTVQDSLKQKEDETLKYQSLLKEDRDKHSMAATLMREELKVLQKCLSDEKQKVSELHNATSGVHSSKLALEQYFNQVHSVENELSELRTKYSSLESQLLASRQESVRWRSLANDRLETMQKLGKDLEDLHRHEITAYKDETEKWREEVVNLKQVIVKYKTEIVHDGDLNQIIKEKDDKIHELSVIIRQAKNNARRQIEKSDSESITKLIELESTKEQLMVEHEVIKKRFDQLLARERGAREEIRELKGKLLKKPILSARSDKTEKSFKEQLQKKISTLENENEELKQSLAQQIAFNEAHRITAADDFNRWNKQKYYQQLSDKLKTKLKSKETDFEKLQETCAGYRILIERIEREKYNLEIKIKNLKSTNTHYSNTDLEMLRLENMKLMSENEALTSRLEMQHHHSGGLGAAMLQEKLEAQERKITILELAAKGTVEVRAELERLQNTISSLQKSNLCLEAENLELKLDLEKSTKETPHLREQIHHLESYIQVLKKENCETANLEPNPRTDSKKVSELERTIFVLKRVVEKLQAENKRLLTGKRIYPDRSEKSHPENQRRLKEQYCEGMKKIAKLEAEIKDLKLMNNGRSASSDELEQMKQELGEKKELLNRVKVLLQRAAAREKALLGEIDELKLQLQKSQGTASV